MISLWFMLYLHFVLMLHRSAEVFTRPSNETLCWLDGGSCESDWEFVWFLACAHIDCLGRTWVRDVEPARFLYMSPRPRHVQDRAESLGQARPHHVPRPGHYQARSCLAPGPRPGSLRVKLKELLQFHTKHVASASKPKSCLESKPKVSSWLQNQTCSLRSKNPHCCLRCTIPKYASGPERGHRPHFGPLAPHVHTFGLLSPCWDLWAPRAFRPKAILNYAEVLQP